MRFKHRKCSQQEVKGKSIVARLSLLIVLLISIFIGSLTPASAQVPSFPALYAGTVKITKGTSSVDAPVGTVVSARVGGVEKGSKTVNKTGVYGEPPFEFLLVQGNLSDGNRIDFFVNNIQAEQFHPYSSMAPPQLNFPLTVVDNQPPVITGMQPTAGSNTTATTITISANYSDILSGVDTSSISLQLNSSTISPDSKTTFSLSHSTTLTPGTYTVTLSLSDNLSNLASQTWSFTISTPVVIIPPSQPSSPVSPPVSITTPVPTQTPVTPIPTPIIPVPTPIIPIIVTPPSPIQALTTTIESQPPRQAAVEIAQAPISQAVQALQQATVDKASQVITEVATPKATELINEISVTRAAEIMDKVATSKAAEIVTQITATRAVEITERVSVTKAAQIMEQVVTDRAAQIIGQVSSIKAVDILTTMAADKAGQAMDRLVTSRLEQILSAMQPKVIQERLPEVSPAKQYEIKPDTIFKLLPQAPTEQLIKETPPVPGRGMEKPIQVTATATSATYNVTQTRVGEWATLVGTPSPVTGVLARFKESLSNVQVSLEELAAKPATIQTQPSGQKVNSYIRIDLPQTASEAVEVGYIRFQVDKSWLKANNIHKWSVILSRYDTGLGAWMSLPTKRVDEDANRIYYTASTPRFSTFAISGSSEAPAPEFKVLNLITSPSPAVAGQPVRATAEVTNLTNASRSFAIPLWVNGTVESSQVVIVAAGGKAEVAYNISKGAGSYEIRVDREVFNLQVTPPPPTPSPTPVATPSPSPAPTLTPTLVPTPSPTPLPTPVPTPTPIPPPPPSSPGIQLWLALVGGVGAGAIITGVVILLFVLARRKRASGK